MNAVNRLVLVHRNAAAKTSARRLLPSLMSHTKMMTTPVLSSGSSFAFNDRDALLADAVSSRRLFSSYSSFNEPAPTLFRSCMVQGVSVGDELDSMDDDDDIMPAASAAAAAPSDAQLRNDIRVMGSILGKIVKQHEGSEIFEKIEAMRLLAKKWRQGTVAVHASVNATAAFEELATFASSLDDKELYTVTRAFTHFLAIANAAEGHHRVRRLQETQKAASALYAKPDSCGGVLPRLLEQGIDKEEIWQALATQTTELVLTAHPTEVNRRTILAKNRRIQEILTQADAHRRQQQQSSSFVMSQLDEGLHREIASIWLSDEVSRTKPTPETEAEKGTVVVDTVLWDTVPKFLRKLNATAVEFLGKEIPLTSSPIRFASWMGGDRDGNPNVKPHTTRIVCLRNRGTAATLLHDSLRRLSSELSLTSCSTELRDVVGNDVREPYRRMLRNMCAKLDKTREWVEQELTFYSHHLNKNDSEKKRSGANAISKHEIYLDQQELMNELLLIHKSLCETGNKIAANGLLTDVIRNLAAFGLTLIPLDVRQESDRHEEAVDAITRFLGLGSYAQWDEQTKVNWLTAQITSKRPLVRRGIWNDNPDYFSETAVDTLEIFQMIADQHEGSLGAYVISQATSPSDVLAVLLLQIDAGVQKPLRVVPLFETLGDLQGAMDTMKSLFSLPAYMGLISGKQEVMIGYSDSAKDAGRLAASWAQYETQEQLAALARKHKVELTFFHGKGGTVGRGGNPQTFHAIMSHAPQTINGKFRVTEQGEMIHQNFGFGDRAERSMDIYTAAVLAEKLTPRPCSPPQGWRDMMNTLSEISCAAYRQVVRGDPRFVPYFRSATPELELASLNIGSRPAKRKAGGGVESLRAIPWNFAWTQTRFNLPTWLGVGQGIETILQKSDQDAQVLRDMYRDWDSFRAMVDVVEMVLAKSEPTIAKHYDDMLVTDKQAQELGIQVREYHVATEKAILDLTQHDVLAQNNPILLRQLSVRNPYVDCLNILQAETLKRIRNESRQKDNEKLLQDTLLISITGVANGMGNTG